jgi:hypothetical protein
MALVVRNRVVMLLLAWVNEENRRLPAMSLGGLAGNDNEHTKVQSDDKAEEFLEAFSGKGARPGDQLPERLGE